LSKEQHEELFVEEEKDNEKKNPFKNLMKMFESSLNFFLAKLRTLSVFRHRKADFFCGNGGGIANPAV